jgi:hypothetical protein
MKVAETACSDLSNIMQIFGLENTVDELESLELTGGFLDFFNALYSTLLHLPPLKFYFVGGCWDRTQDCCDFGIGSETL